MEPRYDPVWVTTGNEEFLGHAGEIDVWYELLDSDPHVLVVGPTHRKRKKNDYNYDVYDVGAGHLTPGSLVPDSDDIHVELHEMCEIYALCAAHGIFEKEK